MTRHASHASSPSPTFPALLPPPMPAPGIASGIALSGALAELLRLEECTVNILRATRKRRELRGNGAMLAALEAEALHRMRELERQAAQYQAAPAQAPAPLPPALASASTSLATAAFVVVALTLAGYRRLEDLAARAGDLEILRFAVTSIAEVGGAARQISRQITRAAGPTA